MPIMQTVIQGGGTTPTGTKTITNNGIYDVTDFASADVQVPSTAPDYYVPKTVYDGEMNNSDTPVNLNNVTKVCAYCFTYAFYGSTATTAFINSESLKVVNLKSCFERCCNYNGSITTLGLNYVEEIGGDSAFYYICSDCTSLTATGLTNLEYVWGPYACGYAFSGCIELLSTDLSNLERIGRPEALSATNHCTSMFSRCSKLTSTGLVKLKYVYGRYACQDMFKECTLLSNTCLQNLEYTEGDCVFYETFKSCPAIQHFSFDKLETVKGNQMFLGTFDSCTGLIDGSFPKLRSIIATTSSVTFGQTFKGCTSLQHLYFKALTPNSFNRDNIFDGMFSSGIVGCTVHFPPQIQSTISSWSSVQNGFGGTNTIVLFDQGIQVTVSIPTGYTVYVNGEDITNSSTCYMYEGDNEIVSVSSDGKIGKYTFTATAGTTTFTFDPTQITYNEITCTSNITGATYSARASSGWVTVNTTADANDKIYCSAGFNLFISGTATGYYADPVTTTSDTSGTATFTFVPATIETYDTTNFLSSITGDTTYASVDSVNNQLLYHYPTSANWTGSVQIALNVPAGTTKIKIATRAYVSSEANYDFGYLALGTARANPQPTYQNVKNGTIANGVYLFRQSGTVNQMTDVSYETSDTTQNVLTVGFAQDSSLQGTNTLYIEPISIIYIQ